MEDTAPVLLEVPTIVRKRSLQAHDTSDTYSETMAADLPGYSSLVTTFIAGYYMNEQHRECLDLIISSSPERQKDVFHMLVKGKELTFFNSIVTLT